MTRSSKKKHIRSSTKTHVHSFGRVAHRHHKQNQSKRQLLNRVRKLTAIQPRQSAVTKISRRALNARSTRRVKYHRQRPLKTRTQVRNKKNRVSHYLGGLESWRTKMNTDYVSIRIWTIGDARDPENPIRLVFESDISILEFDNYLHMIASKGFIFVSREVKDNGKRSIWWYHPNPELQLYLNDGQQEDLDDGQKDNLDDGSQTDGKRVRMHRRSAAPLQEDMDDNDDRHSDSRLKRRDASDAGNSRNKNMIRVYKFTGDLKDYAKEEDKFNECLVKEKFQVPIFVESNEKKEEQATKPASLKLQICSEEETAYQRQKHGDMIHSLITRANEPIQPKPFYIQFIGDSTSKLNGQYEIYHNDTYAESDDDNVYTVVHSPELIVNARDNGVEDPALGMRKTSGTEMRMLNSGEENHDQVMPKFMSKLRKWFDIPDESTDFLSFFIDGGNYHMMKLDINEHTRKFIPLPCLCLDKDGYNSVQKFLIDSFNLELEDVDSTPNSEAQKVENPELSLEHLRDSLFPKELNTKDHEHLHLQDRIMMEYVRSRLCIMTNKVLHDTHLLAAEEGQGSKSSQDVAKAIIDDVLELVPFGKSAAHFLLAGITAYMSYRKAKAEAARKADEEVGLNESQSSRYKIHRKMWAMSQFTAKNQIFENDVSLQRYIQEILSNFIIIKKDETDILGSDQADQLREDMTVHDWFELLDIDQDRLINLYYLDHILKSAKHSTTHTADEVNKIRRDLMSAFMEQDTDEDMQINFTEFDRIMKNADTKKNLEDILIKVYPLLTNMNINFNIIDWQLYSGHQADLLGQEMTFALITLRVFDVERYGLSPFRVRMDRDGRKTATLLLYMVLGPPMSCTNINYTSVESILCSPYIVSFNPMKDLDVDKYHTIGKQSDNPAEWGSVMAGAQKGAMAGRTLVRNSKAGAVAGAAAGAVAGAAATIAATRIKSHFIKKDATVNLKTFINLLTEEKSTSREIRIVQQQSNHNTEQIAQMREYINDLVRFNLFQADRNSQKFKKLLQDKKISQLLQDEKISQLLQDENDQSEIQKLFNKSDINDKKIILGLYNTTEYSDKINYEDIIKDARLKTKLREIFTKASVRKRFIHHSKEQYDLSEQKSLQIALESFPLVHQPYPQPPSEAQEQITDAKQVGAV